MEGQAGLQARRQDDGTRAGLFARETDARAGQLLARRFNFAARGVEGRQDKGVINGRFAEETCRINPGDAGPM